MEKLESGSAWLGLWSRGQRCIMPTAGFYEWHMEHGKKNPFLIKLADQELFGFAALWDRSFKPDGAGIESCALITLPATSSCAASTTPVRIRSACRRSWRKKIANHGSRVPRRCESGPEAIPAGVHGCVSGQHASQRTEK